MMSKAFLGRYCMRGKTLPFLDFSPSCGSYFATLGTGLLCDFSLLLTLGLLLSEKPTFPNSRSIRIEGRMKSARANVASFLNTII